MAEPSKLALGLMRDLAHSIGMSEEALNAEGRLVLSINDESVFSVGIRNGEAIYGESLTYFAALGPVPQCRREVVMVILLEENFSLALAGGPTICLEPVSQSLILLMCLPVEGLSADFAATCLERFSSSVLFWNRWLEEQLAIDASEIMGGENARPSAIEKLV